MYSHQDDVPCLVHGRDHLPLPPAVALFLCFWAGMARFVLGLSTMRDRESGPLHAHVQQIYPPTAAAAPPRRGRRGRVGGSGDEPDGARGGGPEGGLKLRAAGVWRPGGEMDGWGGVV